MNHRTTRIGTKSYAVNLGEGLRTATVDDFENLSYAAEVESFMFFKNRGAFWTPTRELLMDHIYDEISTHGDLQDKVRFLSCVLAADTALIVVLFILLLL